MALSLRWAIVEVEVFSEMRETAKRAELPEGFAPRFVRLVDATLAVFKPDDGDAREIVRAFVRAVPGPEARFEGDGGLAAPAPVLVEEVVALRVSIDPGTNARDVKKEYFGG